MPMPIKLIAADMDGTLLDSAKQLPEGLFPLIRALRARGVRFAPASGRQYYTLYRQFGEIADELVYISENGAMVCDGSKIVSFEAMPVEEVCRAVETVRTLPGVYTVVSARDGGIYEDGNDPVFWKTCRCTAPGTEAYPISWNLCGMSRCARWRCSARGAPSRCSCPRLHPLPVLHMLHCPVRIGSI